MHIDIAFALLTRLPIGVNTHCGAQYPLAPLSCLREAHDGGPRRPPGPPPLVWRGRAIVLKSQHAPRRLIRV
eukprot:2790304-Pleurochrysis_carterae.AAC.4